MTCNKCGKLRCESSVCHLLKEPVIIVAPNEIGVKRNRVTGTARQLARINRIRKGGTHNEYSMYNYGSNVPHI